MFIGVHIYNIFNRCTGVDPGGGAPGAPPPKKGIGVTGLTIA